MPLFLVLHCKIYAKNLRNSVFVLSSSVGLLIGAYNRRLFLKSTNFPSKFGPLIRVKSSGVLRVRGRSQGVAQEEMDYTKPSPTYAKSVDQFLAQVLSPQVSKPVSESDSVLTRVREGMCVRG